MYDGELVRLRALEPEDAEPFYRAMNDREVTRSLGRRYPVSRWEERDFVESHRTLSFADTTFAVVTREEDRLVGAVSLRGQGPEDRYAVFGLVISDRTQWGLGYGTDATRTACRFGFEEMGLQRVELWVRADNAAAIRVYEKAGFRHEGTARQRVFSGGRRVDDHLMGLLRSDLR